MKPLDLDLEVPKTTVGMGFFEIDLLEQALGAPLEHFLQPLLRGTITKRPTGERLCPLRIPHGEQLELALGPLGAIGFGSEAGDLLIFAPPKVADELRKRYPAAVIGDRVRERNVVELRFRMTKGARLELALEGMGALRVVAA